MSRKTSSSAPELGVPRRQLDGIAHLAEVLELDALDDAAAGDVEAGDHTLADHAITFSRRRAPAAALRSGWNWTPASRAALDRSDDRAVVVDRGDRDALVGRDGGEAVGEVHLGALRPSSSADGRVSLQCIPAHVRDAAGVSDARTRAVEQPEATLPPSSLSSKRSWRPTQMPTVGRSRGDAFADGDVEAALGESAGGALDVPDAGDDGERCLAHLGRDRR